MGLTVFECFYKTSKKNSYLFEIRYLDYEDSYGEGPATPKTSFVVSEIRH